MNNLFNKILKLAKISVLVFGIAVAPLALTGCNPSVDDNNTDNNVVSPEPDNNQSADSVDKEPVDEPDKKPEEDPAPEDDGKYDTTTFSLKDWNSAYKLIRDGKNYVLNVTYKSGNNFGKTLKREGDKIYYINSDKKYYVTVDEEQDVKITYNTASDKWVGTILDSSNESILTISNANKRIPGFINTINRRTYNTKTGEFKCIWKDENGVTQNVSVFVNKEDSVVTSLVVQVHDKNNPYQCVFSEFGTTSVALPTYTLNGSEIDNSKNVLTVTNGEYNFDYKLIRPIFENWLKGENARNVDLVNETISNKNCETEQVLFMNLSKNKLGLYVVYFEKDSNTRRLDQFNITGSDIFGDLANVNSLTENELTNYLKTANCGLQTISNTKNYIIDYITSDSDFASHQGQFNALTDKIIERAQTVGVQGSNIENAGTPVDYSDYNIVCGFKTVPELSTLEVEMVGASHNFYMGYLVEKNGNFDLVDFRVASKTQYGFNNLYTNITEQNATTSKDWFVLSSSSTDMAVENGDLYIDRIG